MKNPLRGSLTEVQEHFEKLYGTRNLFVNISIPERTTHMQRQLGRLVDAERKGLPFEVRLSKCFAYFMSLVNGYHGRIVLAESMVKKYPWYGCAYCSQKPCRCKDNKRPNPNVRSIDRSQYQWTIADWQKHCDAVYGKHNRERGFWEVYGRATSEFSEFSILSVSGPNTPNDPKKIIEECALELADLFSWILAFAYIKNINLMEEVAKYYQVCPQCHTIPCRCKIIFVSPDQQSFATVGTGNIMESGE